MIPWRIRLAVGQPNPRWRVAAALQSRVGRRVVEELQGSGRESLVTENRVVREARTNGETRLWPSGAVPPAVALTAAEECEQLHGVRRWKDVAIAGDNECGRRDPADLFREIERLLHGVADLVEQSRPVLRLRSDRRIQLVHRRLLHVFRGRRIDVRLLRENFGGIAVPPEHGRDNAQLPDQLGMTNGELQRDAAAHRVPNDVYPIELEIPNERRDVVGHELHTERPADVGRAHVTLEIQSQELPSRRERRKIPAEHLDGAESAVEQNEGTALAMDLVVEFDAVDLGVFAGGPGRH